MTASQFALGLAWGGLVVLAWFALMAVLHWGGAERP